MVVFLFPYVLETVATILVAYDCQLLQISNLHCETGANRYPTFVAVAACSATCTWLMPQKFAIEPDPQNFAMVQDALAMVTSLRAGK